MPGQTYLKDFFEIFSSIKIFGGFNYIKPQSCINESREDINGLTREGKIFFLVLCR